jgi:hypothetical protein
MWQMRQHSDGTTEYVAFGILGGIGPIFSSAMAFSVEMAKSYWRSGLKADPHAFAETVQDRINRQLGGLSGEATAKPETGVAAQCARYVKSAKTPWYGRPGRVMEVGRFCLHPDAPLLIVVRFSQYAPEGLGAASIEDKAVGFLDSLQFLPLAGTRR